MSASNSNYHNDNYRSNDQVQGGSSPSGRNKRSADESEELANSPKKKKHRSANGYYYAPDIEAHMPAPDIKYTQENKPRASNFSGIRTKSNAHEHQARPVESPDTFRRNANIRNGTASGLEGMKTCEDDGGKDKNEEDGGEVDGEEADAADEDGNESAEDEKEG